MPIQISVNGLATGHNNRRGHFCVQLRYPSQHGNCARGRHRTDPQGSVHPGSFPRIFGLSGHAYLVYQNEFSTHIWSTFTHKWSTDRL